MQALGQRGELPRYPAERGQRVGRAQSRDDVTEPVGDGDEWPGPQRNPVDQIAVQDGRREQPDRDGVQQVLAGTGRHRAGRHCGVL
jgi:hypothetical protein